MLGLVLLFHAHVRRIEPVFPHSRGLARVDDRRVVSGAGGGVPKRLMIDSTHLEAHRTAASLLEKGASARCIGRTEGGTGQGSAGAASGTPVEGPELQAGHPFAFVLTGMAGSRATATSSARYDLTSRKAAGDPVAGENPSFAPRSAASSTAP